MTMKETVTAIFGEYEPIEIITTETRTEHTTITDADGTITTIPISVEVPQTLYKFNWDWAAGVVMFGIVLYSLMRMIGGLLKCKL